MSSSGPLLSGTTRLPDSTTKWWSLCSSLPIPCKNFNMLSWSSKFETSTLQATTSCWDWWSFPCRCSTQVSSKAACRASSMDCTHWQGSMSTGQLLMWGREGTLGFWELCWLLGLLFRCIDCRCSIQIIIFSKLEKKPMLRYRSRKTRNICSDLLDLKAKIKLQNNRMKSNLTGTAWKRSKKSQDF